MLPIVACTTFGLYISAQSSLQMICDTPNQSAMRMIVPKITGILDSIQHQRDLPFYMQYVLSLSNFLTTATYLVRGF